MTHKVHSCLITNLSCSPTSPLHSFKVHELLIHFAQLVNKVSIHFHLALWFQWDLLTLFVPTASFNAPTSTCSLQAYVRCDGWWIMIDNASRYVFVPLHDAAYIPSDLCAFSSRNARIGWNHQCHAFAGAWRPHLKSLDATFTYVCDVYKTVYHKLWSSSMYAIALWFCV